MQNSRLTYSQETLVADSTVALEQCDSMNYEELDNALGYLEQEQCMLKAKGLDELVASGWLEAFEDPEYADTIYDAVEQLLSQTESPQLVQSTCHCLGCAGSVFSVRTGARYGCMLLRFAQETLKKAHSVAYPEARCLNLLTILTCAWEIVGKKVLDKQEAAYAYVEELESVAKAFFPLLVKAVEIFGQYSVEIVQTIQGGIEEPSRHVALLIQVYCVLQEMLEKMLNYPFLEVLLAKSFSYQAAQQLCGSLMQQQPLVASLVRLLSHPVFQGITQESYYVQLIACDSLALVDRVCSSRDLAARILGILAEKKQFQKEPDLLIACLGAVDASEAQVFLEDAELFQSLCGRVSEPRRRLNPSLRQAYNGFLGMIQRLPWSGFGEVAGRRFLTHLTQKYSVAPSNYTASLFKLKEIQHGQDAVVEQKPSSTNSGKPTERIPPAALRIILSRFCITAIPRQSYRSFFEQCLENCYALMRDHRLFCGAWALNGAANLCFLVESAQETFRKSPWWTEITRLYGLKRKAFRLTNGDVFLYVCLTKTEELARMLYGEDATLPLFQGTQLADFLYKTEDAGLSWPFLLSGLRELVEDLEVNKLIERFGV